MIKKSAWLCPEGLIQQALEQHPVSGEGTVLNEQTGDFFYDAWKIKDMYQDTIWHQVLTTLPCSVGQARIIKLAPGHSYMAHADIDNRWHLNLTGEKAYLIDLDSTVMHACQRDNAWAYMDASHIHAATNYGSIPRLQLVVRELLVSSQQPIDLVSISIGPAHDQPTFRYKFDNLISPWLNHVNLKLKMSEFKVSIDRINFKLERELVSELQNMITSDYKLIIG